MKKILSSGMRNTNNQFNEINIQWAITRHCNFCCNFCGVYNNKQKELSLDENIIIAKKIFQVYPEKKKTIVVIGGEPTLYNGYEKVLEVLLQYKKSQDTICLFSNGSEDIKKFKNNVKNDMYKNITPLYTYHSHASYKYPLKDKLKILIDNNISFKVNMMIVPNNLQKVKDFYEEFELHHNDKFIFECVPIEQMNILDYDESLNFCKHVNNKNTIENFIDIFYNIYDTDTKETYTEIYSQSKLKLLPKEYFKFIGYRCYSRYRLTIDSDGLLYDFCDRCHSEKAKHIDSFLNINILNLEELIKNYRICKHMYCPICDTSLLYKEKINSNKYLKGEHI